MAVQFEQSLTDPEVRAMLALPYQQTRQRLHVIKQQFDDLSSTPGTYLMPLAIASNTATRLEARCQIGASGAMSSWMAEMKQFAKSTDAAVSSLLAWSKACPSDRFSVGNRTADCSNFVQQVTAWMCGSATLGRMTLAHCPAPYLG